MQTQQGVYLIIMNNVTILALGILISQVSFAQEQFKFGLKAATNIGWLTGTSRNIENDGITAGFAYGLMGDYYFDDDRKYALSSEILISNVKSRFNLTTDQNFVNDTATTGGPISDLNYAYNIQYLEIPLSVKFRTKDIGNIAYWGNFGFSPGFILNARTTITSGNIPQYIADLDPTDYKVNDSEGEDFTVDDFDDKVFLFRFPIIIGGGIEYKLAGKTAIQAGVRYTNTFTDMFVKDKTAEARNNDLAFSVGVLF